MKKISFSWLLLLSIWIVSGCQKDSLDCPPDLPCATQTGENIFGCYINGKPWVAHVEPYVLDPAAHKIEASYDETDYGSFNDNYVRLLGVYRGDTSSSLIIHFKPLLRAGRIVMDSLIFHGIEFQTPHKHYEIDEASPYEIDVTKLDLEKNIISATFSFTGVSDTDTIKVTDGRLDVRYYPE